MSAKLAYSPGIDGLRAVAVLAVVAYHAGMPVAAGYVGVDVFFVISGYLITRLLHDEVASSRRIDFIGFYARRARRILPALVAVIVVTMTFAAVLLPPLEAMQSAKAAAAAFAFAANVYFGLAPNGYFDGDANSNPLLHLWSLGVEEQFYLAWPVVLLLARRRPALALWIIAAASFVAAEVLIGTGHDQTAFFQAPARAWELGAGALVAVYRPRVPAWSGGAGLFVVLAACVLPIAHFPGIGALPAVAGSVMVVAAAADGHRLSILATRPMVWVGLLSYSLYLWHWPVIVLGGSMPVWSKLALSFLLAALSYRFVEQPFRRRWSVWPKATVLASSALLTAGFMAGLATVRHYEAIEDQGSQLFRAVADARRPLPAGCDEWYYADTLKPCTFGPASAGRTAVLVGDSVAMQWFGAFHEIFAGWRFIVFTKSACPMLDAPVFMERIGRAYSECAVWRQRFLHWIDQEKPEIVILGSSNSYGLTEQQWRQGSHVVLRRLSAASRRVVLLRSTPLLEPGGSNAYEDVHRWQGDAASTLANVSVVDMNPHVCPDGECPRQIGGITTYRDRRHLTPVFVESLAPAVREKLKLDRVEDASR